MRLLLNQQINQKHPPPSVTGCVYLDTNEPKNHWNFWVHYQIISGHVNNMV